MKDFDSLSLRIENNKLYVIDQTLLPHEEVWVQVESPLHMISLIKKLSVRGAPLIGVAAACALALTSKASNENELMKEALALREARPTAVNLMWAVDKILKNLKSVEKIAEEILLEDVLMCKRMGEFGSQFIKDGEAILTHCNSGGLATVGIGTAFGVIRAAHEMGKEIRVYVDETRPLLQGGRLTAWELTKLRIPHTLICDNMASFLMAQGKIDRAIVGADRIAMNGDFANKIGTYGVAVSCHYHKIPFHTAAPKSTLDLQCKEAKDIPIEERNPEEVWGYKDLHWAPKSPTYNPAFDITPGHLVTSFVLDSGNYFYEDVKNGAFKNLT